jgi:hypothetical protein
MAYALMHTCLPAEIVFMIIDMDQCARWRDLYGSKVLKELLSLVPELDNTDECGYTTSVLDGVGLQTTGLYSNSDQWSYFRELWRLVRLPNSSANDNEVTRFEERHMQLELMRFVIR